MPQGVATCLLIRPDGIDDKWKENEKTWNLEGVILEAQEGSELEEGR